MAETTGDRLARPDARLLPLPRPQVRPDLAEGLLPAVRLLQPDAGRTAAAASRRRPRCSTSAARAGRSRAELEGRADGRAKEVDADREEAPDAPATRTRTADAPTAAGAQASRRTAKRRRATAAEAARRAREAVARRRAGVRQAARRAARGRSTRDIRTAIARGHGDGGHAEAARHVHPDARHVQQAGREGRAPPCPAQPAAASDGRADNRLGLARWLVVAGESADGPRDGQPHLAAVLRHRHREDGRGLRRAGRAAVASRAARLAGDASSSARRLGHQAPAPADRHERDVSPVVEGDARAGRARPARTGCSPAARGSACRRG